MIVAVTAVDLPGVFAVQPDQKGTEHRQQSCQPRRNPVDDVVELGACPAKVEVAVVFIAHHRIEGVDCLIAHRQRHAADCQIQQRRDDPVAGVFCHRFDRRLGHAAFIERLGIPADNHRNGVAGCRKVPFCKLMVDLHAFGFE